MEDTCASLGLTPLSHGVARHDAMPVLTSPLFPLDTIYVDMRSSTHLIERHIIGSLHIPYEEWKDRRVELPARKVRWVLITCGDIETDETSCHSDCLALAKTIKKGFGDDIIEVLNGKNNDTQAWCKVPPQLIGSGPYNTLAVVWKPSPFVPTLVERIRGRAWASPVRIFDAGCGTGRNAVYLARELQHLALETPPVDADAPAVHITAADLRQSIIERCEKFVHRMGLSDIIRCRVEEIECTLGLESSSGKTSAHRERVVISDTRAFFDIVCFFRFTHKVAISACHSLLHPSRGGWVVVEAFHMEAAHPPDSPQKLLEGELATLLRRGGYLVETIVEERYLAEDGRPIITSIVQVTPTGHST